MVGHSFRVAIYLPDGDRALSRSREEGVEVGAGGDADALGLQLLDGAIGVGGGEVDAAAGVREEVREDALCDGVERRKLDAVVGGEAGEVERGDVAIAEVAGKA